MTTTAIPQAIADIDNRSDDPFADDHDSAYQARMARHWPCLPFCAPSVTADDWCDTCGGCTDRQDAEARQFGVACRCEEGGRER